MKIENVRLKGLIVEFESFFNLQFADFILQEALQFSSFLRVLFCLCVESECLNSWAAGVGGSYRRDFFVTWALLAAGRLRKCETEARASTDLTDGRHLTAVSLHQMFDDSQSKTGAFGSARP